ncbi:MAG: DNA-processing protein DprA [Ruminococcus sp.]|jgi:DNA processing protein|nr:DNA-processing protein DprA [Ruminococcus sp.]
MQLDLIYPETPEELLWFKLSLMFEAGSNRFWEIFHGKSEDIAEIYKVVSENPEKIFPDISTSEEFEKACNERAEKVLKDSRYRNIGIITYENGVYPDSLKEIYNPPMVLYYRGDVSLLSQKPNLSIVGSRKSSAYALSLTDKIIRSLKKYNSDYVFISGFAAGTDIASHISAVRNGCKTIAVKGCGVDYSYPAVNMRFVPEILDNGVIISEYTPGTRPHPRHFPIRNRIIAALPDGVIVTEGGAESGSLSTAHLAIDFGKDVFTIPPFNILAEECQGNIALLREGAIPIYGARDILMQNRGFITELYTLEIEKVKSDGTAGVPNTNSDIPVKTAEGFAPPPDFKFNSDTSSLSEAEIAVLDIIKTAPGSHSASSLADDRDPDEILDIITELEMSKFVFRAANGLYY